MPNNLTRDRLPLARRFRPRLLSVAIVAAGQALYSLPSMAGPEGGQVTGGNGTIEYNGKVTTIEQLSDRLAVDWDSFDVSADEVVNFLQPGAQSIALNRILSHNGSEILGQINANGRVVLVNPRGIVFGEGAQVNVGGMLASGLDIGVDEFMAGDLTFSALEGVEGRVVNRGIIQAATGGSVTLLGKQVRNEGLISARLGSIALAAGKEAVVTFDPDGLMGVRVTRAMVEDELGAEAALSNSGTLEAQGGQILLTASTSQELFSQAVNRGNQEQANSVVVHEDGSFTLGAGADVVNTGNLDVSSGVQSAGEIAVLGENITHSGEAHASGTNQAGSGHIEFHAQDTALLTGNAVLGANSQASQGGTVKVLGHKVGLMDQSLLEASGATGGGEILLGGDYKGGNVAIRNAWRTYVGPEASLTANALKAGDGGRIIVWADDITRYYGSLEGKGKGALSEGGFAEVSGKRLLDFDGNANLSGLGRAGTLLLDPRDISIVAGPAGTEDDNKIPAESGGNIKIAFSEDVGTGGDATFTSGKIGELLEGKDSTDGTNVILEATRDIFVKASISADSANNLTLKAGDDIQVGNNIGISLGEGDLSFYAGVACGESCSAEDGLDDTDNNLAGRNIDIQGRLDTTGNMFLRAADNVTINKVIGGSDSPSSVSIRAGNNIELKNSANITTATGSTGDAISMVAGDGLLTGDTVSADHHFQLQGSDYSEGNLVIRGELSSNGGNISLNALRNVELRADASTGGGNFQVGDSAVEGLKPGSFSNNYAVGTDSDGNSVYATISTGDGGASAGSIEINAGGNVDIGGLDLSLDWKTLDELVDSDADHSDFETDQAKGATQVGSVTIAAGGNATFHADWDFNDTGPFASNGTREGGWIAPPKFDVDAEGNITFQGIIHDTFADGRDILDFDLKAGGTITVQQDVFTSGGNFTAEANAYSFQGAINTRNANFDNNDGSERTGLGLWAENERGSGASEEIIDRLGSYSSSGGDVSLTLTGDTALVLGDITTLATCQISQEGCSGNLTIQKDTQNNSNGVSQNEFEGELTTLDVGGLATLDIGSSDADLVSLSNEFAGGVALTAAGTVTLKSGSDLTVTSPVGSSGSPVQQLNIENEGSVTFEHGDELYAGGLSVDYVGSVESVLTFLDGTNHWTVTGEKSGHITTASIQNVDGQNPAFTFSGFTDLAGGAGNDIFTLNAGVNFLGSIDGGLNEQAANGDFDRLIVNADTSLTWRLDAGGDAAVTEGSADRLGDFGNFEHLVGSGSDTFHGRNQSTSWTRESKTLEGESSAQSVWTLEETGGEAIHDLTFEGVSHLIGGSESDDFTINTGEAFIGTLDGGEGTDTLTVEANSDSFSVWHLVHDGGAPAVVDGTVDPEVVRLSAFEGMETLNGSGSDTLHGRDERTYWTQTGGARWALSKNEDADSYIELSGMTQLVGGSGNDHFVAQNNHDSRLVLLGGEGTNTLDLSGLTSNTLVQVESTRSEQEDVAASNWLISGITELTGVEGEYVTTLRIPSYDTQWTINDEDAGFVAQEVLASDETPVFAYTLNFSGVDTLVGGADGDTFTFLRGSDGNGALTGGIDGGTGANQLVAGNVDNIWSYEEPGSEGDRVATLSEGVDRNTATTYLNQFSNIQMFKGGTGNDQVFLSGAVSLTEVDGGDSGSNALAVEDGTNIWTLDGAFSGHVGDGKVSSFLNIQSLIGSGDDTLKGRVQDNDWVLSGPKAGGVEWWNPDDDSAVATDKMTFDGMSTLEGRSGSDRFTLEQGAIFEGSLVGTTTEETSAEGSEDSLLVEHGSNAWTLTELQAGSVADSSNSDLTRIASFSGIQTLVGSDDDSLTAPEGETNYSWQGVSGTQWTVTNTETDEILTFSGMSSLFGSEGNDTFAPTSTTSALRVDGGGAGTDTLNLADMANQTVVVGESTESAEWKASNLTDLTGSTGTTTLKVTSGHNRWLVDGGFEGQVSAESVQPDGAPSPLSSALNFTGVTHLIGGSGEDSFTVQTGTTITHIEGGGGSDEVAVQSNVGDTVEWTLNADNSGGPINRDPQGDDPEEPGYAVVESFAQIENVTGGEGNDQFLVVGDVTFDGLVNGAGGDTNTLNLSGWINGENPLSIGFGTEEETWNIAGINSLTGSGADASLLMAYGTNTWTITDENAGSIEHSISGAPDDPDASEALFSGTVTFSGFGNLNGGSGEDTFILEAVEPDVANDVAGSITGTIDGGGGSNNTLAVIGGDNTWNLDHSAEGVYGIERDDASRLTAFSNIQALNGSGSDVLKGKNETTYWSSETTGTWNLSTSERNSDRYLTLTGMNHLIGGSAGDTFTLHAGTGFNGTLDGGSAPVKDTLTINSNSGDAANTWRLSPASGEPAVSQGETVRVKSFANLETLNGSGADTFYGRDQATTWTLNSGATLETNEWTLADGTDTLTLTGMAALMGGSAADTF
uniref:two-partner secretion domain-containing protein n=1 Tax=Marinimicrobium agarilyticum TaxID=306546 RepID=UPI0004874C75